MCLPPGTGAQGHGTCSHEDAAHPFCTCPCRRPKPGSAAGIDQAVGPWGGSLAPFVPEDPWAHATRVAWHSPTSRPTHHAASPAVVAAVGHHARVSMSDHRLDQLSPAAIPAWRMTTRRQQDLRLRQKPRAPPRIRRRRSLHPCIPARTRGTRRATPRTLPVSAAAAHPRLEAAAEERHRQEAVVVARLAVVVARLAVAVARRPRAGVEEGRRAAEEA